MAGLHWCWRAGPNHDQCGTVRAWTDSDGDVCHGSAKALVLATRGKGVEIRAAGVLHGVAACEVGLLAGGETDRAKDNCVWRRLTVDHRDVRQGDVASVADAAG